MAEVKITSVNYEQEVAKSSGLVLVDFWAAWCGPCKMLAPVVEQVAERNPQVKVGKINVDEEPELAAKFGIMSIPTLILFRDGQPVNQMVGYTGAEAIEAMWK